MRMMIVIQFDPQHFEAGNPMPVLANQDKVSPGAFITLSDLEAYLES